MIFYLAV